MVNKASGVVSNNAVTGTVTKIAPRVSLWARGRPSMSHKHGRASAARTAFGRLARAQATAANGGALHGASVRLDGRCRRQFLRTRRSGEWRSSPRRSRTAAGRSPSIRATSTVPRRSAGSNASPADMDPLSFQLLCHGRPAASPRRRISPRGLLTWLVPHGASRGAPAVLLLVARSGPAPAPLAERLLPVGSLSPVWDAFSSNTARCGRPSWLPRAGPVARADIFVLAHLPPGGPGWGARFRSRPGAWRHPADMALQQHVRQHSGGAMHDAQYDFFSASQATDTLMNAIIATVVMIWAVTVLVLTGPSTLSRLLPTAMRASRWQRRNAASATALGPGKSRS